MSWFARLSLAQRFSLLSFFLVFGSMFAAAAWIAQQIERGVMNRTADLTALYADTLITHHLEGLMEPGVATEAHIVELSELLEASPFGQSLAAFKIWTHDGRIVYSSRPELIGQQFPADARLQAALAGDVSTELTDLSQPEEAYESEQWSQLIETYAPLRSPTDGTIVGAIEFYQTTDALTAQIRAAQYRSWGILGTVSLVTYLVLARLIFGASRTITRQQDELHEKVDQLTELLKQNEQLHTRVSRAAARTTALNERFLRRVSADLHDGPGQDLALALLRIDELAEICESCRVALGRRGAAGEDFRLIRTALTSALNDLRHILAGLRLPEIDHLSLSETAERAVRDFERKSGGKVEYTQGQLPEEAPLSVKITLYRIVQEALSNGFRHANGSGQRVDISSRDGHLRAEISDNGDGFDPERIRVDHLGLAGMRERAEVLGGLFEMQSTPGKGTVVRATLPLEAHRDSDV